MIKRVLTEQVSSPEALQSARITMCCPRSARHDCLQAYGDWEAKRAVSEDCVASWQRRQVYQSGRTADNYDEETRLQRVVASEVCSNHAREKRSFYRMLAECTALTMLCSDAVPTARPNRPKKKAVELRSGPCFGAAHAPTPDGQASAALASSPEKSNRCLVGCIVSEPLAVLALPK